MSGTQAGADGIGDAVTSELGVGAAVGVGAYVVSYVLTWVFVAVDGVMSIPGVPTWKQVGWVFYNAQFVEFESAGASINLLNQVGDLAGGLTSTVPSFVYYLAPIVVLAVGGYLMVSNADLKDTATGTAAAVGASVVVGYLVLAVVGRFVVGITVAGVSGAPALLPSVLLAGIAYPVVFGGLGGILASQ